jgi:TPR repeat protein
MAIDDAAFERAEAAFPHIIVSGPADAARALETITRTDPEAGRCLRPIVDAYLTHTATHAASSPKRPTGLSGRRLGRYMIQECVGRGGMGAVYRAYDPEIGRVVALKVLHAHDDRFLSEVRAAGTLKHPNIVTIYDCAKIEGQCVIVMEYVEGRTLFELLQKRRVGDISLRLRLLRQLCSALDYAHERGIVHRDIKPANLVVDARNDLKVLDFGIARIGEPRHRLAGSIVGTLRYMSPEQMRGQEVDRRSDIFAVGVVAYEILSYQYPFERASAVQLAFAIAYEAPVPLKTLVPILDPRLDRIVSRALEKRPSGRYVTLAQMLAELTAVEALPEKAAAGPFQAEPEEEVPRYRHALLSPLTWLAIVLPLLAVVVIAAILVERRGGLFESESVASPASAAVWFETGARLVGLGDPASLDEGLALLERSCRAGEPRGCEALGDLYDLGTVVPPSARRAIGYYDRACTGGRPESCSKLSRLHRVGVQIPVNLAAAAEALSRACDLGAWGECNDAGVLHFKMDASVRDATRAVALLTRACEKGIAAGCVNLGRQFVASGASRQEKTRAIDLLERGCDLGSAAACAQAGSLILHHSAAGVEVGRALRALEQGCTGQARSACLQAGDVYSDARHGMRNLAKAASLYASACESGEVTGCAREAAMYLDGRGVRKDEGRAISLWMRSCNGGVAEDCETLAERFRTGAGVVRDESRAAGLRRRARSLRSRSALKQSTPQSSIVLLWADGRPS